MVHFWYSEMHSPNVKLSIRVDKQLFSAQSDFQRIDIFSSEEFGRFLTLDGCMMLTEKDEFIYHEMITHVPMAVHPHAQNILVIGGGDGGAVRELIKYDCVAHIDLVEIDRLVVETCRQYFPGLTGSLDDARVQVRFEDGMKYIRGCENRYDLIIVDSTDPFGPGEGLFTREFYGNCFKALKDDGILVNQQENPYYEHIAAALQRSQQRIGDTFPLSRVYQAHIPTYPSGYWLFGFASKKYHPEKDLKAAEWNALGLLTRYYNTKLHLGAFALPNYVMELIRYRE